MSTSTDLTTARSARTGTLLRVLGAITLGFSGYLHLRIALDRPPLFGDGEVTLSGLFVAQAVAAAVVVVWVLVRGDVLAWLAFAAVAAGSLVALLLSVVVRIPSIGPLPVIYEPLWYTDKYLAAISAGLAVVVALVALALLRRRAR
ncbi:hypothetical protein [uncultured Cellulomonas sp.]|uniref:hypothetical protein n=1 Tax=uncultured Cellulomonas sp. TaxID=189682 RepID=UPI00262A7BF1|nr:hypothetical protein [uncultured Cellulomonas sp.]